MKHLSLKFSTSKAQDTYGYNVVTLTDTCTGRKYKTYGGGYDMIGQVLGQFMQDTLQDELLQIANKAYYLKTDKSFEKNNQSEVLYGMTAFIDNDGACEKVLLDGGCGLSSMLKILKTLDYKGTELYSRDKKGRYDKRIGFNLAKL